MSTIMQLFAYGSLLWQCEAFRHQKQEEDTWNADLPTRHVPILWAPRLNLAYHGKKNLPTVGEDALTCWGPLADMTILTTYANIPDSYIYCAQRNRLKYAEEYKLEYCDYTGHLSEWLSFSWQKWIAVKSVMLGNDGARKAIWWLDADALIMNPAISILAIASRKPASDAIWTNDCSDSDCFQATDDKMNCGVFILRNTDWSRKFIEKVFLQGWSGIVQSDRVSIQSWKASHRDEFNSHIAMFDLRVMNSIRNQYAPGDFVYHAAGHSGTTMPYALLKKWAALTDKCHSQY
mmetsp:Transcript_7509/g.17196  ORF Transcript_7509/g.17196 Transcript_7509/m.17196 type:complete len:291 (+) Transcript_7509:102-974(+)